MIIQIDLAGKEVIEKFDTLTAVNKHWGKAIHPNILKLLKRDTKIASSQGFLWASLRDIDGKSNKQIEKEALEQVQDLVLQNLMSTVSVFENKWKLSKVEKLIASIRGEFKLT